MAIGRRALARLEKKCPFNQRYGFEPYSFISKVSLRFGNKQTKIGNFGSQFRMSKINLIFLKSLKRCSRKNVKLEILSIIIFNFCNFGKFFKKYMPFCTFGRMSNFPLQ